MSEESEERDPEFDFVAVPLNSMYILPTEPGKPPRAVLGQFDQDDIEKGSISGIMAIWSGDMGCWCIEGTPVPPELNEALTERATELGVPGFGG